MHACTQRSHTITALSPLLSSAPHIARTPSHPSHHPHLDLLLAPFDPWLNLPFLFKASLSPITPALRDFQVEMGTKAWCKMYEILVAYELAPPTPECSTVHVCEAPGAFITATNHYLRQMYVPLTHCALLMLREYEMTSTV